LDDIPMRSGGRLPLSVEVASYDRKVTVAIYGELDAATVPVLRTLLAQLPDPQPERLIFELGGLSFTDCAGARAIAGVGSRPLVASSSAHGVRIIRHARPAVRRVFELLDLDIWLIASD
jgi:anti-anti-sigma factor